MDRYYTNLLERTDMETVVGAGWFDDKLTEPLEEDLRFYTTSLDRITNSSQREVAVLYYMGCFAPVHEGHITVMKLAKEAVEAQTGLPVVAGYFAPDHDAYVGTKTDDPAYKAAERVSYIQTHPEVEDWMQVDIWPALYAPKDLNFTTLYDRFNNYMKKWLPLDVTVKLYCVFGGDNYLFANTFTEYGHAVCVPRQGVTMDTTLLLPNERVLWSEKGSSDQSSTKVREMLAQERLEQKKRDEMDGKFYILRDDLELAFPKTPNTITGKVIAQALTILLTSHTGKTVKTVDVLEQVEKFESEKPFISLDCFLETEHKLELTRVFQASDTQKYSKLHTNRTGTAPIEEQVLHIPQGVYDLVDDDIATGTTMNTVATLLNQHGIQVGEFRCLLESYGEEIFDVLDMRDFVLGARNGGLTVKNSLGKTTRAMYAAPYVNLVTRAKMNPVAAISFSLEIWKMNHSIYRGSHLTVEDISDSQNYSLFGFHENMLVEELCAHHIGLLSRVLK